MYIKNSNQVMCYYKNTENRGTREIASSTQVGEREKACFLYTLSLNLYFEY